jgi:hypothetical protein
MIDPPLASASFAALPPLPAKEQSVKTKILLVALDGVMLIDSPGISIYEDDVVEKVSVFVA